MICIQHVFHFSSFFFSHFKLLNQFENTGPPPADRDKIKSLPTVQVTDEHVGKLKHNDHHWYNKCFMAGFLFSPF